MYDLKLKNGGVSFNGGNTEEEKIYDVDSIFQRIEICLSLDTGGFVYNKKLGVTIPDLDYTKEENLSELEMYINQCVFEIVNTRVNLICVNKEKGTITINVKLNDKEYTREVNVFDRI